MVCPQCGSANTEDARRCASCGVIFALLDAPVEEPLPSRMQPEVNKLALASLILAVLGILLFFIFVAHYMISPAFLLRVDIVFFLLVIAIAVAGFIQAYRYPEVSRGIEAGIVTIVLAVLMLFLFPIFVSLASMVHDNGCYSHLRRMSPITGYVKSHQGRLPADFSEITRYMQDDRDLVCPIKFSRNPWNPFPVRNGYGLNRFVAGRRLKEIPNPWCCVLIADSVNPSGFITCVADIDFSRHNGFVALFCDGHVQRVGSQSFFVLNPWQDHLPTGGAN